jgi:aminoglycoside phosphotransferase (APT) family kinase protein
MLILFSSWEMATIGHPLSDLVNLLTPYTMASMAGSDYGGRVNVKFQEGHCDGLPTKSQCMSWYSEVAGWDPSKDISWGDAFGIYRGCIIIQGIAARHAMRVASSARAMEYAAQLKPYAEAAWFLILSWKSQHEESSKL